MSVREPERFRCLSPGQKRAVRLMQDLNCGWIQHLRVTGGEPVFDPLPEVTRRIKLGADNGPRSEMGIRDFALRREHVQFFAHLSSLRDGVVKRIEVRHGLPCSMEVEGTVRA